MYRFTHDTLPVHTGMTSITSAQFVVLHGRRRRIHLKRFFVHIYTQISCCHEMEKKLIEALTERLGELPLGGRSFLGRQPPQRIDNGWVTDLVERVLMENMAWRNS